MNFIAIAQSGFDAWAAKPHNAKWFRRIDGTPIPNDLTVCIAMAFSEALSARASVAVAVGAPDIDALVERLTRRWEDSDEPVAKKINRLLKDCREAADALTSLQADLAAERNALGHEIRIKGEIVTALRAAEAGLAEARAERDNLWMAYLLSQKCFHGGIKSTNPDQRAHDDVDRAIAGHGPKDVTALKIAKKVGRLTTHRGSE